MLADAPVEEFGSCRAGNAGRCDARGGVTKLDFLEVWLAHQPGYFARRRKVRLA
jgi:hypothetical protein